MNRIDELFGHKKTGILSVYFTAGYPHTDNVIETLTALESEGIDLVEIGIPFSDPMADGTVIQQSSSKAIEAGMSLRKLFAQLAQVREHIQIPLIMMGYLNPIMQYGFREFCASAKACGIDGVIIPDLPFDDYMEEYKAIAQEYGIHVIMLITPETSQERIRLIDEHTDGFLYMVSSASTTGMRHSFDEATLDYFRRIQAMDLKHPRLIGFGISNPSTFFQALEHASGAIVGSKFVSLQGSTATALQAVRALRADLGI